MTLTMQIDEILAQRQLTANSKQLSVNSKLSVDKLLTDKEIDYCLKETADLINPKFNNWYIKCLFKLGVSGYMERAEKARKFGNNPQVYFSALLKKY